MTQVLAVRHTAYKKDRHQTDLTATLTEDGLSEAMAIVERVWELLGAAAQPYVVCSEALRAQDMGDLFMQAFNLPGGPQTVDWLYGDRPLSVGDLTYASERSDDGVLIICGHEPDINELLKLAEATSRPFVERGSVHEFDLDPHAKTLVYRGELVS